MLDYTAVFFVGGDQIRYTPDAEKGRTARIRPCWPASAGSMPPAAVIGGSSAGAAMMCDPMICDGYSMKALITGAAFKPDACPEAKGVSLSNGLGFFSAADWSDQHFLKRGRIGRTLMAIYAIRQFGWASASMRTRRPSAAAKPSKCSAVRES